MRKSITGVRSSRRPARAAVALMTAAACVAASGVLAAGPSAAASKSVIKIGVVAPIGVPSYVDPYSPAALRAEIRAINAGGGFSGHPLALVYCNDMGNPNQTIICARTMVSDHVVATIGGSALDDAALVSTLKAAKIPMIAFNPFTQFTSPNEYLLSGGSALGYQAITGFVVHKKIPTAFVLVDNTTALAMAQVLSNVAV